MMIVEAVFHIYEWKKNGECRLLDGRLLEDICITDELILLENVNIGYYNCKCNDEGRLVVIDESYEKIRINRIFSYGKYWESLPAGMSARLECHCSIEDLTDLLLCKIIE